MILDLLLTPLPAAMWQMEAVHIGANWVLSVVTSVDGKRHAGMASVPKDIPHKTGFSPGENRLDGDAVSIAARARSSTLLEASVGLATLNATIQPDAALLTAIDAADWLSEHGAGRKVAVFGRFPFIDDEIRPAAAKVWVFEREPAAGEFGMEAMPGILKAADIVAITSSTLVNHSLDLILSHCPARARVMMLGPSTPLAPPLLSNGIDLLSGVQIADIDAAIDSVHSGVSFRKMNGLNRVTLCRNRTC